MIGRSRARAGDAPGISLLHAAQNGLATEAELLLAVQGVDINQLDPIGATSLFVAAQKGHAAVVEFLLAAGCVNVSQALANGATPCIWRRRAIKLQ